MLVACCISGKSDINEKYVNFLKEFDSVDIDLNTDYDRASKISRAVPA